MDNRTTPEPNGRPEPLQRAQRALTAGAVVGGIALGGLLALVVGLRLLSELLGWPLLGGILAFGVGVGVATAVFDWLLVE